MSTESARGPRRVAFLGRRMASKARTGMPRPPSPAEGYGVPGAPNAARAKGGFRMHALNWRTPCPNSASFARAPVPGLPAAVPQATIDAWSRPTPGT
jgi:hypothetical protein